MLLISIICYLLCHVYIYLCILLAGFTSRGVYDSSESVYSLELCCHCLGLPAHVILFLRQTLSMALCWKTHKRLLDCRYVCRHPTAERSLFFTQIAV